MPDVEKTAPKRTAVKPSTSAVDMSILSSEFFCHSILLLLGKAAELSPKSHRMLYRLGIFYDKSGSPDEALEHLEKAVELKDDEPRYHQYLGFVYEGLGRHDEAVQHFKAVMEMEGALMERGAKMRCRLER